MPQHILLIQDDDADAAAVHEALKEHQSDEGRPVCTFERLRRCDEALTRLAAPAEPKSNRIDALLIDLHLPDSEGIATFDRLYAAAPQVPILILAATQDESIAKLAVHRGAQDYLLKSRMDSYLLAKALRSMVERVAFAEALFNEKERAQVTLNSIGDGVMCTDESCKLTFLNKVAESLTGWSNAAALGHPLEEVFCIIDASTRDTAPNPMARAIRENRTVALTPNCTLVRRDGLESAIEDSTSPIHDRHGQVIGAVMVFHDVSMQRELSMRMAYLAQHDSLTHLPNRNLLNDRLGQAMALAQRHGQKGALLFMDVDRFKHVNDSLGHAIGDRLLQSVAQRLLASVRSSDTVSRQGGDEFVVLLTELTHEQDAGVMADKILLALRAPHHIDDHALHLDASIGIVAFPDGESDASTLLKHADIAMYHAKESGRGNYQFFKPSMNRVALERQSVEHDLRQALDRSEFVLHYQPKMQLAGDGAMSGVEALVRWQHPQRGLVQPAQFISVAEDCGLIVPLGRWVMREACRQARAWQCAGLQPIRISVNTSAVELRAKEFALGVRDILDECGLGADWLELELTETVLMQESKSTVAVLRDLKKLGVQLALDDFGTGYSSLSYVKRFPIDTLKIDQSFVRDLTSDADDASIVSAVIGLGHSLHMRVVAEGIENAEQLAILRAQDCPEGQGFFFCHPVAAERIAQMLM